ncbi:malate permease, partial [Burkholderia multivorans]
LQVGEAGDMTPEHEEKRGLVDVTHIAGAGSPNSLCAISPTRYSVIAVMPAPVAMLFLAVLVKLARAVSPPLQEGAFVVYKFFSTAVT